MARYVRERYAGMSGARMFDTAHAIVLASLPEDMPPRERRRALCRRLYPELDEDAVSRL